MTTSIFYDKKQGDHIVSKYAVIRHDTLGQRARPAGQWIVSYGMSYRAGGLPNSMGAHKAFSRQEGATSWAYGYLGNTRPLF